MSLTRHGNGIQNIGMIYTNSEVITIWGSLTSRDFNFDEDIQGGSKSGATDSWLWFCQMLTDIKKSMEDSIENLQFTTLWNINVSKTSH